MFEAEKHNGQVTKRFSASSNSPRTLRAGESHPSTPDAAAAAEGRPNGTRACIIYPGSSGSRARRAIRCSTRPLSRRSTSSVGP